MSVANIISQSKSIVARAIQRGFCSPPVFTPARTHSDICHMRADVKGVKVWARTIRNRDRFGDSTLKDYFDRFIEKHEAEFTPVDFMNWLTRSELKPNKYRVRMLLVRRAKAGVIVLVKRGNRNAALPVYKKALATY